MSLKDQLQSDSVNCFLNSNEFAEEITFCPHDGANKTLKALVLRQRVTPAGEDGGRSLVMPMEIMIANDAIYGVSSINKGFDKVILPKVIGGSNTTFVIVDILDQDDGMWHLLLRA